MAAAARRGDTGAMTSSLPLPPDARFYAVTTTGIYCRPACPSRPPKPENLRFFAAVAAAEVAGFRACKRCRPSEAA